MNISPGLGVYVRAVGHKKDVDPSACREGRRNLGAGQEGPTYKREPPLVTHTVKISDVLPEGTRSELQNVFEVANIAGR